METLRAEFHNGHLWNPDTKKRIIFRNESEVVITVSGNDTLYDTDPNNKPHEVILGEEEQRLDLQGKQRSAHDNNKFFEYRKILDRGKKLYFIINAGIRDKDKTDLMKTFFEVTLLEDLYIVRIKLKDKQGRVEPCACIVEKQSGYDLPYFEPVYAFSLNDAYSKTYVLYFNVFGKATANVYDRFYTELNRSTKYLLKHLRTFSGQLALPLE